MVSTPESEASIAGGDATAGVDDQSSAATEAGEVPDVETAPAPVEGGLCFPSLARLSERVLVLQVLTCTHSPSLDQPVGTGDSADTDEMCAAIKDVFEDTRVVLEPAGALEILAHRIVWCALFVVGYLVIREGWGWLIGVLAFLAALCGAVCSVLSSSERRPSTPLSAIRRRRAERRS